MYEFFGKEPAAIIGVISAILIAAVNFGLPLTSEQAGLITAAIAALGAALIAWRTKHTTLAVMLGALQAAAALAGGFGLEMSTEQLGALSAALAALFALYNRSQTSPVSARPGSTSTEPMPV